MERICRGAAGTTRSGDIYIELVGAAQGGVRLELTSAAAEPLKRYVRRVILKALSDLGIAHALVRAVDRGALDSTIRARVTVAGPRRAPPGVQVHRRGA